MGAAYLRVASYHLCSNLAADFPNANPLPATGPRNGGKSPQSPFSRLLAGVAAATMIRAVQPVQEEKMAKQPNQPQIRSQVSTSVIHRNLTLGSDPAQKAYKRSFERTANAIYRVETALPIIAGAEAADEAAKVISELIEATRSELDEEIGRMDKLLEDHGLSLDGHQFSDPKTYQAPIASPSIPPYLALIEMLDKIAARVDILWLGGVLNNKQRSDGLYRPRQKVIGLGSRIIGMERNIRDEARGKQGTEDAEKSDSGESQEPAKDDSAETGETAADAPEKAAESSDSAKTTKKKTTKKKTATKEAAAAS